MAVGSVIAKCQGLLLGSGSTASPCQHTHSKALPMASAGFLSTLQQPHACTCPSAAAPWLLLPDRLMSRLTTWAGLKNTSLARCRMDALPSVRTVKPSGTGLLEVGRAGGHRLRSSGCRRHPQQRRLAVWAALAAAPCALHACNWGPPAAGYGAPPSLPLTLPAERHHPWPLCAALRLPLLQCAGARTPAAVAG